MSPSNAILPPEILLLIFRATHPPRYRCDYSISAGIDVNTPWLLGLRTRLALATVYKAWLGPAREVLYEEVVFRRMGQIPALARTLRSPVLGSTNADIGRRIRTIRIDSCVVFKPFHGVVAADLKHVIERCTMLDSLSYRPHPELESVAYSLAQAGYRIGDLDPTTQPGGFISRVVLENGLRELDLSYTAFGRHQLVSLHTLLSAGLHLTTLSLGIPEASTLKPLPEGRIVFPILVDLSIAVSPFIYSDDDLATYIAEHWHMPRLQRLTIVNGWSLPARLIPRCGAHLRFLQHTGFVGGFDGTTLARDCPVLEHLVMPAKGKDVRVVSSTLRHLDLWVYPWDAELAGHEEHALWDASPTTGLVARLFLDVPRCAVPKLETVRILAFGDMRRGLAHLPSTCHPSLVSGLALRVWNFPQMRVVQTAWGVFTDTAGDATTWARGWVDFDPLRNDDAHVVRVPFAADMPPRSDDGDVREDGEGGDREEDSLYDSDDPDDSDYEPSDSGTESSSGDSWGFSGFSDSPLGEAEVARDMMLDMYSMGIREATHMHSVFHPIRVADSDDEF